MAVAHLDHGVFIPEAHGPRTATGYPYSYAPAIHASQLGYLPGDGEARAQPPPNRPTSGGFTDAAALGGDTEALNVELWPGYADAPEPTEYWNPNDADIISSASSVPSKQNCSRPPRVCLSAPCSRYPAHSSELLTGMNRSSYSCSSSNRYTDGHEGSSRSSSCCNGAGDGLNGRDSATVTAAVASDATAAAGRQRQPHVCFGQGFNSRHQHHLHHRIHPHLHLHHLLVLVLVLALIPPLVPAVHGPTHNAEAVGNATLRALYPNHYWDLPVVHSDTPRGPTRVEPPHVPFIAVQTDDDQLQLYDENLELDLAPWRRRNRSEVTVAALMGWAAVLPRLASQRLVMIKGGQLALLQQKNGDMLTCERPCDILLNELIKDLRTWVAESPSEWPDVVFFLNAADTSLCQQQQPIATNDATGDSIGNSSNSSSSSGSRSSAVDGTGQGGGTRGRRRRRRSKAIIGRCPAPVLSVIKEWDRHKDEDILVPLTMGMNGWPPLHYFPWSRKINRAVFRGTEYCHTRVYAYAPGVCSRTYMAYMTQYNPDWSPFVDVGLVGNYTLKLPNRSAVHITGRGFVRTPELARFRYVLALDGITASSRLAHLLSLNSVVLKQASPWIEWYYRSLVPGTHYVSIWNYHRSDVLHVIKSLQHKERYLYDIATHGQAFAYRYLTPRARRLYWLRLLREYKLLFSDMDAFMAAQEIPRTGPAGGP